MKFYDIDTYLTASGLEPESLNTYEPVAAFEERTHIAGLLESLRVLSPATYVHSKRIGNAALLWAANCGELSDDETLEMVTSLETHDIGKLSIGALLSYTAVFSEKDRWLINAHAQVGAHLYDSLPHESSDAVVKQQAVAQTMCHHMSHTDARGHLKSVQGTALSPFDLHTFVRISDMIDASGNFAVRPYLKERYRTTGIDFIEQDGVILKHNPGKLVDDVADALMLDPTTGLFGKELGQVIQEVAVYLPVVMPPNEYYDADTNSFESYSTP